ncbi:MAG: pitrilysin family protein [Bacteroidales bacterium]
MHYQQHTLPNGLRIIHMPSTSDVSYCGFAVNAGTRDELVTESGMAHLVEHMIFKGTDKRRSWHILNRMEKVGGELNAYTTKEETFVYSVFLEENFDRASELLCDLVLNSRFPENELEKETDVILDEINSYRDNPPELIYDEFENKLFQGHALGRNILGTEESLESFSPEMGRDFLCKWYRPENMVFFSTGKTDFKKVVRALEKYFNPDPAVWKGNQRQAPTLYTPTHLREERDTHQGHVIIGNRAFNMFDPRRASLALLNNMLGGPGMNSRLNLSLRERRGYVYNVESAFTPYSDTGVFSVYFGCDQKNLNKCIELVHKELKDFRDKSLTSSQLEGAKRQIKGQLGISNDNKENVTMGMAKSYLHYNRFDTLDEAYRKIQNITANDILETANEIFDESKLSTLIYV